MHDGRFLERLDDKLTRFAADEVRAFADADVLASIQDHPDVVGEPSSPDALGDPLLRRLTYRGVPIRRVTTEGYLIRPVEGE